MDRPAGYGEVDALITDAYLESLLAARQRRAWDAPSVAELDPAVRAAAARLADAVVRVHPSFRFEERLAARLAEAAGAMALPRVAGDEGVRLASDANGLTFALDQSGLGPLGRFDLDDPAHPEPFGRIPRRPLLIGGTLASAAISIAGAAIVAWRWNRAANSGHSGVRFI
jgi:hypothetical protein